MPTLRICDKCEAELPIDAPEGLCPRCLLLGALDRTDAVDESAERLRRIRYFGDYELCEEIARGGMGIVFRATQTSLKRTVALKMIIGSLASEAFVKRFRTEAEAVAQLDHPNIVPIYEVGEHEGQQYFSMRLIEGGTLAERLREHRFAPEEAARLIARIARAVHYAHQRGILHRDLKPGNILLDISGEPYVVDFGLAKLLHENSDLTQSQAIVGTVSYMSPEQARGKLKQLTTASDTYSLGAMLFELLAGKPPFTGESKLEVLRNITEEQTPRALLKGLDRNLATVCQKCLEKNPQRRYGTAKDLADDLECWLKREPIHARPATIPERVLLWCRRRPVVAGLSAALTLAVLTGFLLTTWQWRAQLQARHDAERQQYYASITAADLLLQSGSRERAKEVLAAAPERFRNWEWGYLLGKAGSVSRIIQARSGGEIGALSFSTDGSRIVTGDHVGSVKVREFSTGKELVGFGAAPFVCHAVLDSRRGRMVTLSSGGNLAIFDSTTQERLLQIQHLIEPMKYHDVSDDGEWVLVSSGKKTSLWNVELRSQIQPESPFPKNPHGLELSPDGKLAAFHIDDHWTICEAETGEALCTTDSDLENGTVAFSRDNRWFAGSSSGTILRVIDAKTGRQIAQRDANCRSVAFMPDIDALVFRNGDTLLEICDVETLLPLRRFHANPCTLLTDTLSPDGRWQASVSSDGNISVHRMDAGEPCLPIGRPVSGAALDPAGTRLLASSHDGSAMILNLNSNLSAQRFSPHLGAIKACAFSPDGQSAATAGADGTIRIWDAKSGKDLVVLRGHAGAVTTLAFDNDREHFLTGGADGTVRLWNLKSEEHRIVATARKEILQIALSANAKEILVATVQSVSLVSLSGIEHVLLPETAAPILAIAFDSTGKRFAIATEDGRVTTWKTEARQLQRAFLIRDKPFGLAFSPDGTRLFAASGMLSSRGGQSLGSIDLWELENGRQLLSIPVVDQLVRGAMLAGDGRCLFVWGLDKTISTHEALPWPSGQAPIEGTLASRIGVAASPKAVAGIEQGITSEAAAEAELYSRFRRQNAKWPARLIDTPSSLVNLDVYYNSRLDMEPGALTDLSLHLNTLAELPTGILELGGVKFDVRALIQLVPDTGRRSGEYHPFWPDRVEGIRIGQRCAKLHFLHSAQNNNAPTDTVVAVYVLHYTDGTRAELPVLSNRHIADWWTWPGGPPLPTEAEEVWTGSSPSIRQVHPGGHMSLFLSTRENPAPEKEIERLDFIAPKVRSFPFLVAITLE